MLDELFSISPVDGRYRKITENISNYFSEFSYIKYRIFVEIKWFLYFTELINKKTTIKQKEKINEIYESFDISECKKVKEIEKTTNHDVKAIEYYLRNKFSENKIPYSELIHFACTSEDINNLAYALMLKDYLKEYILLIKNLISNLKNLSSKYKNISMLGHTHGQPATPTTVGKEFKVFEYRINNILNLIKKAKITGKFNGTVGNFNAHVISYPQINWIKESKTFVEGLGINYNPITTQIESHDNLCVMFNYIKILNNIINDLDNDMWHYISINYFKLKVVDKEVGSSVMPHKVNPINFENSMANSKMSIGIINTLVDNLSISKLQRDLSDSSLLRNIGVLFSYSVIAINQTITGLSKIDINKTELSKDLNNNMEVLAEAVQTILRKNKYDDAYEKLKELTRGKDLTKEDLETFIKALDINEEDKKILLNLTPSSYIGLASKINY